MRYSAWPQIQVQVQFQFQVQVQVRLHQQNWRIFAPIFLSMTSCFISENSQKMLDSHQQRRLTVVLKEKRKKKQAERQNNIEHKKLLIRPFPHKKCKQEVWNPHP